MLDIRIEMPEIVVQKISVVELYTSPMQYVCDRLAYLVFKEVAGPDSDRPDSGFSEKGVVARASLVQTKESTIFVDVTISDFFVTERLAESVSHFVVLTLNSLKVTGIGARIWVNVRPNSYFARLPPRPPKPGWNN